MSADFDGAAPGFDGVVEFRPPASVEKTLTEEQAFVTTAVPHLQPGSPCLRRVVQTLHLTFL